MAGERSKILIIGGTGYMGKFIVEASARSDHPSFALVRDPNPSDPATAAVLEGFKTSGVTLIQLEDQTKIIAAIKEAGNIKERVSVAAVCCLCARDRRAMAGEKSKILVIGGTGYIGKFVVEASAHLGHPTFALVRDPSPADPAKAKVLDGFNNSGVTLIQGDLYDHASLVRAIKQVDVVISTVGYGQIADQTKIIAAIKEAGNVKRFLPSEYGNDVDRVHAVEPSKSTFIVKAQIRRAIEAARIPYTYVTANFFARYFLPSLGQAGATTPPRDRVIILGDGNPKAIFVDEEDVAAYIIKAVDDPRTLNKSLYLDPPANTYSYNELISLWEKKIGKTIERVYVPEEEVLKQIQGAPFPINIVLSLCHSVFVKGDQTNFEIHPSFGVRASELYPEVKYTTVDEYLNRFV